MRAAAQVVDRCDEEGGEEVGEEEGARVDRIYVLNADLNSLRAAAQVVSAVMGREERRYSSGGRWGLSRPYICS